MLLAKVNGYTFPQLCAAKLQAVEKISYYVKLSHTFNMRFAYIHLKMISAASDFTIHDTRCAVVWDAYTGGRQLGSWIRSTALHYFLRILFREDNVNRA